MSSFNIVKKSLSLFELTEFSENVLEWSFHNDEYIPEFKIASIKINTAKYYTDIQLKDDFYEDYEIVKDLNVEQWDIKDVDIAQYYELMWIIDEKINEKKAQIHKATEQNITIDSPFYELVPEVVKLISTLDKKFSEIDVEKLNKHLSKINARELVAQYFKKTKEAEAKENKKVVDING